MLVPELLPSRNRALVKNNWYFGKPFGQFGHPFIWADGDAEASQHPTLSLMQHFASWFSTYYETFEIPNSLNKEQVESNEFTISEKLRNLTQYYNLDKVFSTQDYNLYIKCHSRSRAIDVSILQSYATKLNLNSMFHLDFGPGMAGHAVWNSMFNDGSGTYLAAEINDANYALQRQNLSHISNSLNCKYTDYLALETMGLSLENLLNTKSLNTGYSQIPSWNLVELQEKSVDLITATTVLNEITYAGIGYFVEQVLRLLKIGGYVYIKDSGKTKPGRHNVNYEKFLVDMGFELDLSELNLVHRKNIHGLPRLYRKTRHEVKSFEQIMDIFAGEHAMTLHGGSMVQNISSNFSA
jgi:hypothetical protein